MEKQNSVKAGIAAEEKQIEMMLEMNMSGKWELGWTASSTEWIMWETVLEDNVGEPYHSVKPNTNILLKL